MSKGLQRGKPADPATVVRVLLHHATHAASCGFGGSYGAGVALMGWGMQRAGGPAIRASARGDGPRARGDRRERTDPDRAFALDHAGRARRLPRRRPHGRGSGDAAAGAGMMLGTSRAVRVFAFPSPVDLRKGYD